MAETRRLFVAELPREGGSLRLPEESARHAQVLRLVAGEVVELFDAAGALAAAEITRIARGEVSCVAQAARVVPERRDRVTLVLGVPKAQKLEPIVRMTTELGIHALALAQSERSVPKLSADSPKLERVRRVTREACAQSGQAWAPAILAPEPLLAAAARAPEHAHKLVFWEEGGEALDGLVLGAGPVHDVWAVVGPEGGLARSEVEGLARLGYRTASLGEAVLRVDTAAVVIAALLLDRLRTAAH